MSTDQITGPHGQLQYAPVDSYKRGQSDDVYECDECHDFFPEEYMMDVRICKGKMTIPVCMECYEKKYEFYD